LALLLLWGRGGAAGGFGVAFFLEGGEEALDEGDFE
jgi:hypothetical protein